MPLRGHRGTWRDTGDAWGTGHTRGNAGLWVLSLIPNSSEIRQHFFGLPYSLSIDGEQMEHHRRGMDRAWVGLRVKPSFSNGIVTEILRCTPASVFSEIRAFFRFFRKAPN